MVSGGCIISGTEIRNSILSTNVRTNSFAVLENAVVLPDVVVNRFARLKNCVIDRSVIIPKNLVIGEDPIEDAKFFRVTEKGVTLITKEMVNNWQAAH